MPIVREMHYDVTDKNNPKIKHRWKWWSHLRIWWFIKRSTKVKDTTGFDAFVKFRMKK